MFRGTEFPDTKVLGFLDILTFKNPFWFVTNYAFQKAYVDAEDPRRQTMTFEAIIYMITAAAPTPS